MRGTKGKVNMQTTRVRQLDIPAQDGPETALITFFQLFPEGCTPEEADTLVSRVNRWQETGKLLAGGRDNDVK